MSAAPKLNDAELRQLQHHWRACIEATVLSHAKLLFIVPDTDTTLAALPRQLQAVVKALIDQQVLQCCNGFAVEGRSVEQTMNAELWRAMEIHRRPDPRPRQPPVSNTNYR